MIAALLGSTKECEGPWVNRRAIPTFRVRGMQSEDIIDVLHTDHSAVSVSEDGVYPIPQDAEKLKVVHVAASGSPVTVTLE